MNTIPFTEKNIREYIDRCILYWRSKRNIGDDIATYYIDAFQSVRMTLFGETLAEPEERKIENG